MKKIIVVIVLSLAVSGCTTAQLINRVVSQYCAVKAENRHVVRKAVALATTPNKITIKCAADG